MVYFFPGDFLFYLLETCRFILIPIFSVVQAISKSETIAKTGVDGVLFHVGGGVFEKSLFASLLIGTISGCGGGILGSMINVCESDWRFGTPSQFKSPNSSMILSLLCSIVYLILHRGYVIKKTIAGTPLVFFFEAQVQKYGIIVDQLLTQEQTIALMVIFILTSSCFMTVWDTFYLNSNYNTTGAERLLKNKVRKSATFSQKNSKKMA